MHTCIPMALPKKQRFITAEIAEGAEFKTRAFQSMLVSSDASAFSAHSAVKLSGIEILLENSTGSLHPTKEKYERYIYALTKGYSIRDV
ncbi:hypothetical protein C5S29_04120 [ANME-1 cluster archaeon GoMg3.2]|nr:hypothetical protein [ANME-1 cluster archaeon GoMg3.2]